MRSALLLIIKLLKPDRLLENPIALQEPIRAAIESIAEAVRRGDDLSDRLSTAIQVGYASLVEAAPIGRRASLDLLLNDWTVHHLHLGAKSDHGEFAGRTSLILFACFASDAALFINVYPHEAWSRDCVAHVLIDEWPTSPFVRNHPLIVGSPHRTDAERALLRKHGIQAPIMMRHGQGWSIGATGGVSSAGNSIWASLHANWLTRAIRDWASHVESNPSFVEDTIRSNGLEVPSSLQWRFTFLPRTHYGVREVNSGALFLLN